MCCQGDAYSVLVSIYGPTGGAGSQQMLGVAPIGWRTARWLIRHSNPVVLICHERKQPALCMASFHPEFARYLSASIKPIPSIATFHPRNLTKLSPILHAPPRDSSHTSAITAEPRSTIAPRQPPNALKAAAVLADDLCSLATRYPPRPTKSLLSLLPSSQVSVFWALCL